MLCCWRTCRARPAPRRPPHSGAGRGAFCPRTDFLRVLLAIPGTRHVVDERRLITRRAPRGSRAVCDPRQNFLPRSAKCERPATANARGGNKKMTDYRPACGANLKQTVAGKQDRLNLLNAAKSQPIRRVSRHIPAFTQVGPQKGSEQKDAKGAKRGSRITRGSFKGGGADSSAVWHMRRFLLGVRLPCGTTKRGPPLPWLPLLSLPKIGRHINRFSCFRVKPLHEDFCSACLCPVSLHSLSQAKTIAHLA
jgi:hypothetical protein